MVLRWIQINSLKNVTTKGFIVSYSSELSSQMLIYKKISLLGSYIIFLYDIKLVVLCVWIILTCERTVVEKYYNKLSLVTTKNFHLFLSDVIHFTLNWQKKTRVNTSKFKATTLERRRQVIFKIKETVLTFF